MKTTRGGKVNMKGNSTDFCGLSVCKRGEGSDEVRGQSVESCQVWSKGKADHTHDRKESERKEELSGFWL